MLDVVEIDGGSALCAKDRRIQGTERPEGKRPRLDEIGIDGIGDE